MKSRRHFPSPQWDPRSFSNDVRRPIRCPDSFPPTQQHMSQPDDPIDIAEDLLTFSVKPRSDGVHQALSSISITVATNGRVLEQAIRNHHSLRQEVAASNELLLDELRQERTARLDLESKLLSLQSAVRALEASVARKDAVTSLEHHIGRRIESLEERAAAVESGACATLNSTIYDACTATLTKRIAEVEDEMSIRLDEASDSIHQQVAEQQETHASEIEKSTSLRIERAMAEAAASVRAFGEELTARHVDLEGRFVEGFEHMSHRLIKINDDVANTMCHGFERMAKWLDLSNISLDALFSMLFLDKGKCVEVCNALRGNPPPPRETHLPIPARTAASTLAEMPHEARRTADFRTDQHHTEEIRNIVFKHTAPLPQGAAELELAPSHDEATGATDRHDPRLQIMSMSPHATAFRAAVQREMSSRVEILRAELQQDMVSELLDLQRELKGKVTANKLGELLSQYRDHQLYNTVKVLGADLQEIRANKIDLHTFYEVIKAKADTKALDQKVGHEEMEAQFDVVRDSTERLLRDVSKAHERLRHSEVALRNLHTYVLAGGGVYATKQVLDAKLDGLASSAIVLQPSSQRAHSIHDLSLSPIEERSREAREALHTSVDAASILNSSAAASALKQRVARERETQMRIRARGSSLHRTSDIFLIDSAGTIDGASLLAGAEAYNETLVVDESAALATALRATRAAKTEELTKALEWDPDTYRPREEEVPDQTLLHSGFVPDSETCLRDSAEWQLGNRMAIDSAVQSPAPPKKPARVSSGKRAPLPSHIRHAQSPAASAIAAVNMHVGGFPRPSSAPSPTPALPLTRGQIDYCDALGLERAATGKALQRARPGDLAKAVKPPTPRRGPNVAQK